jgi:cobalamin biosynthesis protein CobT
MGLFNFIETFFFISLGITFVLILLLVYHFKQRISSLEHKCDTMFEIINNVVQEVTIVRGATNRIMQGLSGLPITPIMMQHNSTQMMSSVENNNEKDEHEDDDEDQDEDDDEDEDEDQDEDDDEDQEDDEEDEDDENQDDDRVEDNNLEKYDKKNTDIEPEITQENKDDVIIIDSEDVVYLDPDAEIVEDVNTINLETIDQENINNTNDEMYMNLNLDTLDEKVKEHIESTDYKNMNLQSLKTLVVSKGLVTNASKLKKNEFIDFINWFYKNY